LNFKDANFHPNSKIAVGMSGGVDSSVAALLLHEQGFSLMGFTLKLTCDIFVGGRFLEESSCCTVNDLIAARENCRLLGIDHRVINLSARFKNEIVEPFAQAYLQGKTPNPCIECNRRIKWQALTDYLSHEGVNTIATGHYARIHFNDATGRYELWRGKDRSKDQSYVLWGLSQKNLSQTRFPLGELTKKEVRELADSKQLENAHHPESQDICFVPDNDYRNFLREFRRESISAIGEGVFTDVSGRIIGKHSGYWQFTVGQRKGLRLAMGRPVYVKTIVPEENRVVVADKGELNGIGFTVTDPNWISIEAPGHPFDAEVKVRYRHSGIAGRINPLPDGKLFVNFADEADTATPGQSAVFYQGEKVLGGGIIEKVVYEND
jgi:tRNA-uridine 2-sulfurtransferase